MITTRLAAALGAGALAVGILAGSAGTIVLRDATSLQGADWTAQMSSMMGGSGGMMGGAGGMMGGAGGMMGGANGSGSMPDWMQQHHVAATPAPVQ